MNFGRRVFGPKDACHVVVVDIYGRFDTKIV